MDEKKELPGPELVRGLMDPAPSGLFSLRRHKEDGSIEEVPIRVRKLRVSETRWAIAAAQKAAKKFGELDGYGDIYRECQADEVLRLSLCRPEIEEANGVRKLRPMFVTTEQLRDSLDETEMAQCLNMYEIVKAQYGAVEDFDEERMELYIEKLSDTMEGPLFLSLLDSRQWPLLILSLARSAQSLRRQLTPTPSSSDTTSESTPSTSESGIISSSELPDAQSADGKVHLPTDKLLSKSEARKLVRDADDDD